MVLVIEVSETSSDADRLVKVPLYARAGIPEVWLVALADARVEISRLPTAAGYRDVQRLGRGGHVAPHAFPDLRVSVDDVLG